MSDSVRVLIVDDSASIRRLIKLGLEADPRLDVVAEAGSAREAREAVRKHNPDVMTLDVEMPQMDGLEFLRRLMKARPMPVVMVSSHTVKGSEAAVRALALGAVECIGKPRFGRAEETLSALADALCLAAKARVMGAARIQPTVPYRQGNRNWNNKIVLIGASTGGVEALEAVLTGFPTDCPPTLITQHMPAQFLVNFAARLNGICKPNVSLAQDASLVQQGQVMIAPGGEHHMELSADGTRTRLRSGEKVSGHRPSVDALFLSARPVASRAIATLLTGMGSDGAAGMAALRSEGALCIAQDKETSVIYGMPRMACELGGVDVSLPLGGIAGRILDETNRKNSEVRT